MADKIMALAKMIADHLGYEWHDGNALSDAAFINAAHAAFNAIANEGRNTELPRKRKSR